MGGGTELSSGWQNLLGEDISVVKTPPHMEPKTRRLGVRAWGRGRDQSSRVGCGTLP